MEHGGHSMGGMGGMMGMSMGKGKGGKPKEGIEEMGIMTTNFAWEMPDEMTKDASKGQNWSQKKEEKEDAGGWFAGLLKGGKEEKPTTVGGAGKADKPTLMDLLTGKLRKGATNGGRALAASDAETTDLSEALGDLGDWAGDVAEGVSDLADTLSDLSG
jgi:hypothetical protein